jgi:hypothetical protein
MIKKLINPFHYVAGIKSLIFGLIIIFATSIVGYLSRTHFPDIISIKTSPEFSFWYFVIQNFSNWFIVSTLFYIASIIFSKSSVRLVDIYGTQALARFPYFIASFVGFYGALNAFGKYLLWTLMRQGEPCEISVIQIISAILLIVFSLLLTIWLITLMFNAFKISANLKGIKLILIFIIVLIISLLFSGFLTKMLILKFQ